MAHYYIFYIVMAHKAMDCVKLNTELRPSTGDRLAQNLFQFGSCLDGSLNLLAHMGARL